MGCGSANPYLLLAGMVAAGIDGIQKKMALKPDCGAIAYGLETSRDDIELLPKNLAGALQAFEADTDLKNALGEEFVTLFKAVKQHEVTEFDNFTKSNKD